jgi:hypothetical protein
MSFTTEPKSSPNIAPIANATPTPRERAIAKLMEAPSAPVRNPSQVAPEEISVVKPPTRASDADSTDTTTDAAPPEATKPAPDPLSARYAQLARQERALRAKVQAQEAAFKAKEAAFNEQLAAAKAKDAEYSSNYVPKSRIKSDPLSVMTEEGVTYDELTQAILNPQAKQDPRVLAEIEKLRAEVKEARAYQDQAKEESVAQQKLAYNQAVTQIRNETKQLIANDPSFEMIKGTQSVGDVVDLIEKTYARDGILLSVEEAASEVEEYLTTQAVKLAKINKIRSKLQEVQKPTQQQQASAPKQAGMKTLTNSVNASKSMSARDRAIAAFKGELK